MTEIEDTLSSMVTIPPGISKILREISINSVRPIVRHREILVLIL